LPGHHRDVRVAALQRLDAGFPVEADDVLVDRGVVIDVQDLVAFCGSTNGFLFAMRIPNDTSGFVFMRRLWMSSDM
jgi:hypothetical protein